MKKIFSLAIIIAFGIITSPELLSQCPPNANAVLELVLTSSQGGTQNRSAVAFNPIENLYYSANAGSGSYPVDVFDQNGNLLQSNAASVSWRGLWWDDGSLMVFGNQHGGLQVSKLEIDQNGLPDGTVSPMFTFNPALSSTQTCAAFDSDAGEIIAWSGSNPMQIYNSSNGVQLRTLTLNFPDGTSEINTTSIIYNSCSGNEYGLYNYVNGTILWFDKSNGNYSGLTNLPSTFAGTDDFNFSFSNNLIWIYDRDNNQWNGFSGASSSNEPIPTLSQWGIIALSMIMLILGIVTIRQRKVLTKLSLVSINK